MKTKLALFLSLIPVFILDAHAGSATGKLDPSDNNCDNVALPGGTV